MLSYPENAPKIDWSYYRKSIINKSVVDQLESAYKALSITYPKDTLSQDVDAQEENNKKEVELFCKDSEVIINEANKLVGICLFDQKLNLMNLFNQTIKVGQI